MGFFYFLGREKGERVLEWVNVKEGLERRGIFEGEGQGIWVECDMGPYYII